MFYDLRDTARNWLAGSALPVEQIQSDNAVQVAMRMRANVAYGNRRSMCRTIEFRENKSQVIRTSSWRFIFIAFFGVTLACSNYPQVDYSRWKGVEPDVEYALPKIVLGEASLDPENIILKSTRRSSVIRFRGEIAPSPSVASQVIVSLDIFKVRNGKEVIAQGESVILSFQGTEPRNFELLIHAPSTPGQYQIAVKVGKTKFIRGSLNVR